MTRDDIPNYAKVRGQVLFRLSYDRPDFAGIKTNFSLSKVAPFVGCVRLVGSQRLRFSRDRLANAVLACAHLGASYPQVRDILTVCEWVSVQFMKEYGRRPDHAELSVLLKTIDFWCGSWGGFYTLFNKLSVDESKKELWDIFEKRITSWMLEERFTDLETFWPYMERVLNSVGYEKVPLSFRSYLLNRDLWGAAGATDNKHEVHKLLAKTKGGFAYSLSDEKLIKWWEKHRDEIRPWSLIKKEEPGAVRLVALTDIVTYLKQAYLMLSVDRASAQNDSLFAFSHDPQSWWAKRLADYDPEVNYLLGDYQNFDESATRELIRRYITKIIQLVGLPPDNDWAHIDTLVDQLYNATVTVPDGKGGTRIVNVMNGLASGLRITTHFNSVFNLAMITMANEKLGNWSDVIAVLGDDSVNKLVGPFTVADFSDAIAPSGVTLHPRKSYIAAKIEFLKLNVTHYGVRGNPIRALRALLWSSEEERDVDNPVEVVKLRCSLWTKFLSRCMSGYSAVYPMMLQDIVRAAKIPHKLADAILHSPACVGGVGIAPRDLVAIEPVVESVDPRLPKFSIKHSRSLYPVWQRGVLPRLAGLTKSRRVMLDLTARSVKATSAVFTEVTGFRPRTPRIPLALNDNYDKIKYTFKGLRSRKEFFEHQPELLKMSFVATNFAGEMFSRFSQRLAIDIIHGNDPIAMNVPPWATIQCGEVLDVLWGRTMTNRLLFNLPNRVSFGTLEALKIEIETSSYNRRYVMTHYVPNLHPPLE